MKDNFKLGSSVFDVESNTAELSVTEVENGIRRLVIQVEAVADQVSKDEVWNWSGFPPKFYLRGFPVPDYHEGTTHVFRVPMKHDEYEMALYLGEHNDVMEVWVTLTAWNAVEINGIADAMGLVAPFHIKFGVNDAQQCAAADRRENAAPTER